MLWIVRASQVSSLLIDSEGFRITGLAHSMSFFVCFKKPGATFTSDLVIFYPFGYYVVHTARNPWNFRAVDVEISHVVSGFGRRCRKASGAAPGFQPQVSSDQGPLVGWII